MTAQHDWLDKYIIEQANHWGLSPDKKADIFKGAAEFDEMLTAGVVDEPTKETTMKKYTVLLKRPDFISNDDEDTYLDHVEAENVADAQKLAQMNAFEGDVAQEDRADYDDNVTDGYRVLLVVEGFLKDLKVET